MIRSFIVLLVLTLSFSSCESAKKAYLGIGKTEVKIRAASEVIKYYEPFLKNETFKTKVFVISNYDSSDKALKNFRFPGIFIKNRETGAVYELDCFEDVKASIDDINNNSIESDITVKDTQEFLRLTEFINNGKDSKLITSTGESSAAKKWDVYMSYATFLGNKIRRLTLPVTTLKDVNELTILDLSIDKSAIEIN